MSSEPDQGLERFAFRFLESKGTILERNEDGIEALLPEELSGLLGTPDYIRLHRESGHELQGVYSINYGSPLLDKIINAACEEMPLLTCRLEFDYLKSQGFGRLIKEQFSFYKTVGHVESWAKIKTDYLLLSCRYTAHSDEQKEGLLHLVFNHETGALAPHMADMLSTVAKDFETLPKSIWKVGQLEGIMERVKNQSKESIMEEIRPFQESMTRRFRRDVTNLEEYYDALKTEMRKSLGRPGLSDELIMDRREKIALLPDELARKKDDLFKKYSIKTVIEPCAAMLIRTPAVKILYRLAVGRNYQNLSLIYNPVTKSIDPLVCQGCGKSITRVSFCNHFHLLCFMCNKGCPVC